MLYPNFHHPDGTKGWDWGIPPPCKKGFTAGIYCSQHFGVGGELGRVQGVVPGRMPGNLGSKGFWVCLPAASAP